MVSNEKELDSVAHDTFEEVEEVDEQVEKQHAKVQVAKLLPLIAVSRVNSEHDTNNGQNDHFVEDLKFLVEIVFKHSVRQNKAAGHKREHCVEEELRPQTPSQVDGHKGEDRASHGEKHKVRNCVAPEL